MDQAAETLEGGDTAMLPPLDPLLRQMNLLPMDTPAILTFLKTLNSDHYDKSVPKSVPSGLPVPRRASPGIFPSPAPFLRSISAGGRQRLQNQT
jgi:hypothetical protein